MKKSLFAILAFVFACTSISLDAQKKPNLKKNKQFIQVYTADFWNTHNIEAFDKYYADDLIVHFADADRDSEQYKGLCQAYFAAFPDMKVTIDDLIFCRNEVVVAFYCNLIKLLQAIDTKVFIHSSEGLHQAVSSRRNRPCRTRAQRSFHLQSGKALFPIARLLFQWQESP